MAIINTDVAPYDDIMRRAYEHAKYDIDPISTINEWMATLRAIQPAIVRSLIGLEHMRHTAVVACIGICAAIRITLQDKRCLHMRMREYFRTRQILFAVFPKVTGRLHFEIYHLINEHADQYIPVTPSPPSRDTLDTSLPIAPCGHNFVLNDISQFRGPICPDCEQSLFS